jgi:hypothetical protein
VSARYCTSCASLVPEDSRFCPDCGAPFPVRRAPPVWGHHPAFRFQVEPNDPPYRDVRWIGIVVGFALATIGGLFLVVWGLVSGATVPPATLEYVFLLPGAAALGVGVALVVVSLYRTLAPSYPARR